MTEFAKMFLKSSAALDQQLQKLTEDFSAKPDAELMEVLVLANAQCQAFAALNPVVSLLAQDNPEDK